VLTTHYDTGLRHTIKLLHHPKTVCSAIEHHDNGTTSPQAIKLLHHYQTALSALTKHHSLAQAQTHPIKLSHHHQPVLTTHYCLLHWSNKPNQVVASPHVRHTSSSCCITTKPKQLHQRSQNTMDMVLLQHTPSSCCISTKHLHQRSQNTMALLQHTPSSCCITTKITPTSISQMTVVWLDSRKGDGGSIGGWCLCGSDVMAVV
jgi:hypothetical protein